VPLFISHANRCDYGSVTLRFSQKKKTCQNILVIFVTEVKTVPGGVCVLCVLCVGGRDALKYILHVYTATNYI
jgi:hypothetical protein